MDGAGDSGQSQDSGEAQDSAQVDSSGDSGAPTDSGTDGDAGHCSPKSTLHPPDLDAGATLYCPFSMAEGGGAASCTTSSEHCCEPPPTSGMAAACEPTATACSAGSIDWQCQDPVADCPSGQVCCAPGASIVLGAPGCGNSSHTMTGTTCVANAAACTGIVMCTSDGECPAGQKCTPFEKAGSQVGGCM